MCAIFRNAARSRCLAPCRTPNQPNGRREPAPTAFSRRRRRRWINVKIRVPARLAGTTASGPVSRNAPWRYRQGFRDPKRRFGQAASQRPSSQSRTFYLTAAGVRGIDNPATNPAITLVFRRVTLEGVPSSATVDRPDRHRKTRHRKSTCSAGRLKRHASPAKQLTNRQIAENSILDRLCGQFFGLRLSRHSCSEQIVHRQ